jgi:putative Holliday junction resolvase
MAIDLLENMLDSCPQGRVLLGLDVGAKTIGVAVSDSAQRIAMPLKTIKRTKFSKDAEVLLALARDYEVGGYVIGLPLNMDGSEGRRCQSVRDFAAEFALRLSGEVWIALRDERLSTEFVEGFVGEVVDISIRRSKEKGILDKLAAQFILQRALDFMEQKSLQE